MFDADMQFSKLKNFLHKNPRILKEDPVIGQEYMEIIKMIRRKKLIEYTAPAYSREHTESLEEQEHRLLSKNRFSRSKLLEIELERERLQIGDQDANNEDDNVVYENIKESGDTDSLMKQFEKAKK
jgi:hypothetical protein